VIYLAAKADDTPVLQRDISKALAIPQHFLGKILQILVHHNIVASQKGKSGGFFLKRSPNNFSLYDIIKVIDGSTFLDSCVLGFPGCSDESPCPVHEEWKETKKQIIKMLQYNDIEKLSKGIDNKLSFIKTQTQIIGQI
jgi:Rrf2 family protein